MTPDERIERRRRQFIELELEDRISRVAAFDDLVSLIADRARANVARELRAVAGNPEYGINRILTIAQINAVADEIGSTRL
jgi:hypothetical protein